MRFILAVFSLMLANGEITYPPRPTRKPVEGPPVKIICDCYSKSVLEDEQSCRNFLNCADPKCRQPGSQSAKAISLLSKYDCDKYERCWTITALSFINNQLTGWNLQKAIMQSKLTKNTISKCTNQEKGSTYNQILYGVARIRSCYAMALEKCKNGKQVYGKMITDGWLQTFSASPPGPDTGLAAASASSPVPTSASAPPFLSGIIVALFVIWLFNY